MPRGRRVGKEGTDGSVSASKRPRTNDDQMSVVQSPEIPVVPMTAPDDDWQMNKSLSACLDYLQEKSHLTDVTFEFPEEDPVPRLDAHKLILAARSPVFEAMFYGLAGRRGEEGPIEISDSSSKTFRAMLRFVYTDDDSAITHAPDVIDLLQLSHKYRINCLVNACCTYLESHLTLKDILAVLETAMLLELNNLKQICLTVIDDVDSVNQLRNFEDMKIGTLLEIFKRGSLKSHEMKIYNVCRMWAQAECRRQGMPSTGENMRQVLGVVLQHIRFPLIGAKDIADVVSKDGMLTDKQLLDLFLQVSSSDKTVTVDGEFSSTPRVYCWKLARVNEPVYKKTSANISTYKETVKVKSSQDLCMFKFVWENIEQLGCLPPIDKISGKITVDGGYDQTCCTDFKLVYPGNLPNAIQGRLLKPILLRMDTEYTMTIDLSFEDMEMGHIFKEPTKLTFSSGAEVSWSSNQVDSSLAVNKVLLIPSTCN